ncbi:MAG: hypothetical protein WC211_00025 [Dehalococcoidia bacterium]
MTTSTVTVVQPMRSVDRAAPIPFLVRFATTRAGAWTPRGETTLTLTVETTDE